MRILNISFYLIKGLNTTLSIYLITTLFAIPLGVVFSLGKRCNNRLIKSILEVYTWIFRGTPLLLQLVFIYFGLGTIGVKFTPFAAANLAFILNYAAYYTEIFRGGIDSIDKGQYEGAYVIGLNRVQTMINIIFPQAFKRVIPAITNESINLVKDTALVSVIGMGDMLRNAKEIVTREFNIVPLFIAGILYLILTYVILYVFKILEKKYAYLN